MKTSFITLTSKGYVNFTRNLIKSLESCKFPLVLKCYCYDNMSYEVLQNLPVELVNLNNDNIELQNYKEDIYCKLNLLKMKLIHDELLKNDYVLFTDGDIVFLKEGIIEYVRDNIDDADMIAQFGMVNKKLKIDTLCTGFMFIKSNKKMLDLFDVNKINFHENWIDQKYINTKLHEFNYKTLPVEKFAHTKTLQNKRLDPYIVHFTDVLGNEKEDIMRQNGYWYL